MKIRNYTIGARLAAGLSLLLLFICLVCGLGFKFVNDADKTLDKMVNNSFSAVEYATTIADSINSLNMGVGTIAISKDKSAIESEKRLIASQRESYKKAFDAFEKLEKPADTKKLLDDVKTLVGTGRDTNNKVIELATAGNTEEATKLYLTGTRPFSISLAQKLDEMVKHMGSGLRQDHQAAVSSNGFYRKLMMAFGVISLALGIFISIFLTKSIVRPLSEGVSAANRLAEGDLTVNLNAEGKDEASQLLRAMQEMAEKWKHVIYEVKTSADNVASASQQLSAGAEQMSHGSDEQASRASQVATSSEEMSQTVTDVAKSANGIATSASDAARTARDGKDIVDRAVQEVREIAGTVRDSAQFVQSLGERSNQIGQIVNVINDIADQTNLLALNAAIEAARAGEQGRGFAVVADEVRKLAERTAQATSEINAMIIAIQSEVQKAVESMNNATGKVQSGVELSAQAGNALHGIVSSVDDLQLMVQQIASATDEMTATSDQISKDIERIASVSKESSISSQQTAQAATEMSKLSLNLQSVVREFKVSA